MFSIFQLLADPYDGKARIAPALLCGFPLIVLLFSNEFEMSWVVISLAVLYGGGAMSLSQIVRDCGNKKESLLHDLWGEKPSVGMLRHSDIRLDPSKKARYRAYLGRAVPGLFLASPDEEQNSPDEADRGYEVASSWLLEQTRDPERFRLLFQENMHYGFRRNVWALRIYALCLNSAVALAVGVSLLFSPTEGWVAIIRSSEVVQLVILAVHIMFFIIVVDQKWVHRAAETYAKQLLASCDLLERDRDRDD